MVMYTGPHMTSAPVEEVERHGTAWFPNLPTSRWLEEVHYWEQASIST